MKPESKSFRSPVYRKLQALDAAFVENNGYAVAATVGDSANPDAAVRQLSLCDLSGHSRIGFKGPGTCKWIAGQGLAVPEESNRALRQNDGALLARLAPNEVLILCDEKEPNASVDGLADAWHGGGDPAAEPRGFIVPRQHSHAWFRLTGAKTADMLAKLCGVDLRTGAFDNLQVAQTSVARLNAIVIRDDFADIHAFHLLADSASAAYWWDCLLDAGLEYDTRVVGWDTLRALNRA